MRSAWRNWSAPNAPPRYNKSVLVAYYDGHVGLVSINELKQIDSEGGANNIFWNADGQ